MPRRTYRRAYKRRYRRSRLSKTRVLTNTSAKSQALQINALNTKMNNMYRKLRPEFKSYYITPVQHTFNNEVLDTTWIMFYIVDESLLSIGTSNSTMTGDYVYIMPSYLQLTIEYYNNLGQMMHQTEPLGASIRFIVLRTKSNMKLDNFTPDDILSHFGNTGADYELNTVTPLKTGITERFAILADKTYTLTPYHSHVYSRIKFRGGSFRKNNQNDFIGKGAIFCVAVTSGLHWDADMKEYLQLSFSAKVPFRDN